MTMYSLVVTDPTTNPALIGLSMGERTGSRVFQWVWSMWVMSPCRVGWLVDVPHTESELKTLTTALTEVGPLALGTLATLLGRTGFNVTSTIIYLRQCATATAEAPRKGINGVPWYLHRPIVNPLGDGVTAVSPGDAEKCLIVYKRKDNRIRHLHLRAVLSSSSLTASWACSKL
ncbi:hypothetical protein LZ32DRAFT_651763 [Colletotrichum eremochloae]|nr:hypothetical protein LZ32DRAFT_651763 [Colletotrichum eremochloae]